MHLRREQQKESKSCNLFFTLNFIPTFNCWMGLPKKKRKNLVNHADKYFNCANCSVTVSLLLRTPETNTESTPENYLWRTLRKMYITFMSVFRLTLYAPMFACETVNSLVVRLTCGSFQTGRIKANKMHSSSSHCNPVAS